MKYKLLIDRTRERIPGFNDRSQSLADLERLCEQWEITLVDMPLRDLHGYAYVAPSGSQYLVINRCVAEPYRVIAGFHEFDHLTDQTVDTTSFASFGDLWNRNKHERQAQAVGALALMPDAECWGYRAAELMERYRINRKLADFRVSLMI